MLCIRPLIPFAPELADVGLLSLFPFEIFCLKKMSTKFVRMYLTGEPDREH